MKHIPNILSTLRILMAVGFAIFFFNHMYVESLVIYVIAFITDLLDGYLARKYNWISDVGKVLDPLADKLMLICALVCFCLNAWVPWAMAAVVVLKELLMIIGGAWLYKKKVVVYADFFGKFATGMFNVAIVLTFLKNALNWEWLGISNLVVLSIAIICAIIALVHYAKANGLLPSKKS